MTQLSYAHNTRLSSMQLNVVGYRVDGVLLVNAADLQIALASKLSAADDAADQTPLDSNPGAVAEYVTRHVRVLHSPGAACSAGVRSMNTQAEHVRIEIRWSCSPSTASLVYVNTLFHEIDPASRQMLTVNGPPRRMALLSSASPEVVLGTSQPGVGAVFGHYLLAGIEHIVIGYDHIAFLVAVMLWGRRLWPLVSVVTAFTVAHSVTLSLAVVGVVSPPARLVEVLIALSVAYVATENFFVRDLRRRWIITFLFGLVHGFGFAGVLREYGIPQNALGWALAAFNSGVELGQLAIVAVAFLLLRAGERAVGRDAAVPDARLVYPVSAVILVLGLYWSVERAFFA